MRRLVPATLLFLGIAALAGTARQGPMQEWPVYGGDQGGAKSSPLADIDQSNVAKLAVAWEWRPKTSRSRNTARGPATSRTRR